MTAITEERSIFENEEWLVTESGLEHKATGYFIERESIGNRREDGLWTWPLHMAEKSWCAMMPFAEAFSCAAAVYDVRTGTELAQTFKVARCEVAPWPHCDRQVSAPAPLTSRALQSECSDTILVEPGSSEKFPNGQGFQSPKNGWRLRSKTGARPFPAKAHPGSSHTTMRTAALPWRAPRRIRNTGTRLVQFIQSAWSIR